MFDIVFYSLKWKSIDRLQESSKAKESTLRVIYNAHTAFYFMGQNWRYFTKNRTTMTAFHALSS